VRRLLLLLLLVVLVPAGPAAAQDARNSPDAPAVVVVGVAGLRWDDLGPETSVLSELAGRAARGVLSVKALPAVTCRGDGWLTLGAGARAEHVGRADGPCDARLPEDLERQRSANADSRDGAVLGALSQTLKESSSQGPLEVEGPGALLCTAGPLRPPIDTPAVRIVDAGSISEDDRATSARAADRAVGQALVGVGEQTDVLVVGLSEAVGGEQARLHVALAAGPSFPPGALVSASTRRAPFVQLIDVAPTVLELVGIDVPEVMDGQPWRVEGAVPDISALADLDLKARAQADVTVPFFVVALGLPLAVVVLGAWRRRWVLVELAALAGAAGLGASYLANLLPWWRAGVPLLALMAVVAPVSLLVAVLARSGRRGTAGPAGAVCGFVAVIVLADLVTGAHLQMSSVAGYSPLVAGRFAGIGNVAFGVLAAAVLLATAVVFRRALPIAAVGVVTVVVDGAPPWGSDVGGVLALVPAFVLLAMLRTGTRVSVLRLAAAGAAGAAVVTAFALADWSRDPADRTHLGRFVQDLADGTAGQLLTRKAGAVLDLLVASPVSPLLPLVVAGAAYLVARPPAHLAQAFRASPAWRHGLLALGLAALLGFLLNDSGAAVPALALCVGVPATLAVVVRARRQPAGAARL